LYNISNSSLQTGFALFPGRSACHAPVDKRSTRVWGVSRQVVHIHKWPICPISVWREKFYPRHINPMPGEKFFERLDRDPSGLFLDGH
jgi:hypothetical protein